MLVLLDVLEQNCAWYLYTSIIIKVSVLISPLIYCSAFCWNLWLVNKTENNKKKNFRQFLPIDISNCIGRSAVFRSIIFASWIQANNWKTSSFPDAVCWRKKIEQQYILKCINYKRRTIVKQVPVVYWELRLNRWIWK